MHAHSHAHHHLHAHEHPAPGARLGRAFAIGIALNLAFVVAEVICGLMANSLALVADAIRDCSRRGDIVLDSFGGSGTTLIAADQVGRRARLIEFDPLYCDTIVQRWQRINGKQATLSATGQSFEDVQAERHVVVNTGAAA